MAAGFTQLVLVTGARSPRAVLTHRMLLFLGGPLSWRAWAGLNRTLGLSDKLFVLVDSVLLTGLGRVMMMPSLVLAARICPEVRASRARTRCGPSGATEPRRPCVSLLFVQVLTQASCACRESCLVLGGAAWTG